MLLPDAQSPDTVLPQSFPIPDAFDRLLPDGRINSGTSAFHPTDKAVCSLLLIVAVLYFASFAVKTAAVSDRQINRFNFHFHNSHCNLFTCNRSSRNHKPVAFAIACVNAGPVIIDDDFANRFFAPNGPVGS